MLTKPLRRMHDNLMSMQTNRKPMSKEQEELLGELVYLNMHKDSDALFSGYSRNEIRLESFAPPSDICPNCGKRY